MSLKQKTLALAILPLLLAIAAVGLQVMRKARALGEQQAELIESSLLAQKRAELRHAVELVETQIESVAAAASGNQGQADESESAQQARVKALLGAAHYGEDGYFFVYDLSGTCLVHPRQPELVGKNLQSLVDAKGRRVIPALLETAQRGDGFQRYTWEKPSSHRPTEKLGYVSLLPRWGWVIGTGIYLDDVERASQAVRQKSLEAVQQTLGQLTVVAVLALVSVFAGGMALNVSEQRLADGKLKAMAARIVHLQEEERARVSRELHDGISQLLVAMKFQFELARQKLEAGDASALSSLDKGLERLRECIADVRRISHALRPAILDQLGLSSALRQLAEEFQARTGIRVEVLDSIADAPLSERESVTLFRIAQEALTNVERHAAAQRVTLEIGRGKAPGTVRLRIADDGRGFDPQTLDARGQRGIGLRNIRERVEDLGGEFHVESRPGHSALSLILKAPA
ncbi:MAG TPA: cache domain-containing protein [Polyangiaceae bacterium]|nr:cache domain-containing protein [Polyangiaceae bacterium]